MDTKKLIAGAIAAAAALTFSGSAAIAAGPGQEETTSPQQTASQTQGSFTGSVEAPVENESADDDAEDRELQNLAEIDEAAAEEAALQAVPGTVVETDLDDENGYVVYDVEVAGDDGKSHDVTVDAGNGDILQQYVDDDDSDDYSDDDGEDD